jgi:DNA-binding transcriptional MerR regulator
MPVHGSFEIAKLSDLLGTTPKRLNKLLDISGTEASVAHGEGRGNRRLFSLQDACKLGLVLWLRTAGVRGPAIRSILTHDTVHDLVSRLGTLREIEAESRRHRLLVAVDFRGETHGYSKLFVGSARQARAALRDASGVVVPIGTLLKPLIARLQAYVI